MPFEIVRNDITNMRADAIVNTAIPLPGQLLRVLERFEAAVND